MRERGNRKIFEEMIAKFSKFNENYKPTGLRNQPTNQTNKKSEHKKHVENYTKAHYNQIAQYQC